MNEKPRMMEIHWRLRLGKSSTSMESGLARADGMPDPKRSTPKPEGEPK